jgi:hypothetical protein
MIQPQVQAQQHLVVTRILVQEIFLQCAVNSPTTELLENAIDLSTADDTWLRNRHRAGSDQDGHEESGGGGEDSETHDICRRRRCQS